MVHNVYILTNTKIDTFTLLTYLAYNLRKNFYKCGTIDPVHENTYIEILLYFIANVFSYNNNVIKQTRVIFHVIIRLQWFYIIENEKVAEKLLKSVWLENKYYKS